MARDCLVCNVNEGQEPLGVIGDHDELIPWVVGELIGPELSFRIGLNGLDQRSCAGVGRRAQHLDGAIAVPDPHQAGIIRQHAIRTRAGVAATRTARRRNPPNEHALANVAEECIGLSVNEIDRFVRPVGKEVLAGGIFDPTDVETGCTRWIDRVFEGDRIVAGRSQTRAHREKN